MLLLFVYDNVVICHVPVHHCKLHVYNNNKFHFSGLDELQIVTECSEYA